MSWSPKVVLLLLCALVAVAHTTVQKRSPVTIRSGTKKDRQDLSKVPGVPGVDYPLFKSVPPTNFHCGNVPYAPGMYANVETGCQAYHVCHDGREGHQGAAFLCPNGTLFNQHEFACDWWYNVNCADATRLYDLNLDPNHNPYFPKKKPEEEHQQQQQQQHQQPQQYHQPQYQEPQYQEPQYPQYHQPQYDESQYLEY